MAFQEGVFYKICAMYPSESSEELPSSSSMVNRIRVTENTSRWRVPGVKIGKPHSCYLVRFDPNTSIGVILLGLGSPCYSYRFIRVHGGTEKNGVGMLTTIPPLAFNEVFYLNLSYPLRAKLQYVQPSANLNSLKSSAFGLNSTIRTPLVGITDCNSLLPRFAVTLDALSVQTIRALHKAYHVARPSGRSSLALDENETSSEDPPSPGVAPDMAKELAGAATQGASLLSGAMSDNDSAPWGKIGKLRIGLDIPCILDDYSDEESSDSDMNSVNEGVSAPILDGVVIVSDFSSDVGVILNSLG